MRHGKKFNHLSRKPAHRKAMLSNMACSLIQHKRINTTVAKAKALRKYVEPLITKSKLDTTHSRRTVFTYLKSKDAVSELFREVAPKVADRPGGFTRIIRTGFRLGDAAEMCMIELVDFNELYTQDDKKKTRRSRRGGAKKKTTSGSGDTETKETSEKSEDTPKAEKKEAKAETKTAEKPAEEKKDSPKPEAKAVPAKDEKTEEPKAEESKEEKKADDSKKSEPKADASEDKKDDKSEDKKDNKKGE